MKGKWLAMLTAAVLLFTACTAPAQAWGLEDTWAPTEENETQVQPDYQALGGYLSWTGEQKEEALNTWDSERWESYWWGGYDYDAGYTYFEGYYDLTEDEAEFDAAYSAWEADQVEAFHDFADLGAYGTWTQEQKDAALDGWGTLRWDAYWSDYYDSFDWPDTTQYDQDESDYYDDLYTRQEGTGEEDGDWWAQWIRSRKVELGMPYPDGLNVSVNGRFLDFGDTAPIAVERRTMVPFRAFFEELGAQVAYEDGHITARLGDGETLELDGDSNIMTHTVGDKIDEIDMGVRPYVQDRRVYIPARFAGEALGYEVSWDEEYAVAHFVNWDSVAAGLDGKFTTLNSLLALEPEELDEEKTYEVSSALTAALTLYGETEEDNGEAKMALDLKGLVQGSKMDLSMALDLDGGELRELLVQELDEEELALLEVFSQFDVELRGDMAEGLLYLRGSKLDKIPESPIPADTWVELDLGRYLLGLTPEMIMESAGTAPAEERTVGKLLVDMGRSSYSYGGVSPCTQVQQAGQVLAVLLGDEVFTAKETGSATSYTLRLDEKELLARCEGLPDEVMDEDDLGQLRAVIDAGMTLDLAIDMRAQGGELVSESAQGTMNFRTGGFPVELRLEYTGNGRTGTAELEIRGGYLGKLTFTVSSEVKESTKTVPTVPADGEKVVPVEEL